MYSSLANNIVQKSTIKELIHLIKIDIPFSATKDEAKEHTEKIIKMLGDTINFCTVLKKMQYSNLKLIFEEINLNLRQLLESVLKSKNNLKTELTSCRTVKSYEMNLSNAEINTLYKLIDFMIQVLKEIKKKMDDLMSFLRRL